MEIDEVIKRIINKLPKQVTKEQLINAFIDAGIDDRGNEIIVSTLVYAARKAGKEVVGKSALDVNIDPKEKLKFIVGERYERPEKLKIDIDILVKEYLAGKSTSKLSKKYGWSKSTINNHLKKSGIKLRLKGRPKKQIGE